MDNMSQDMLEDGNKELTGVLAHLLVDSCAASTALVG